MGLYAHVKKSLWSIFNKEICKTLALIRSCNLSSLIRHRLCRHLLNSCRQIILPKCPSVQCVDVTWQRIATELYMQSPNRQSVSQRLDQTMQLGPKGYRSEICCGNWKTSECGRGSPSLQIKCLFPIKRDYDERVWNTGIFASTLNMTCKLHVSCRASLATQFGSPVPRRELNLFRAPAAHAE